MPSTDAAQEKLQQNFAAQRRKDLLAMQTKDNLREHNSVVKSTVILDAKPRRIRRLESRAKNKKEKKAEPQAIEESTLKSALKSTSAGPKRLSEAERKAELAKTIKPTLAKTTRKGKVRKGNSKESGVVRKGKVRKVNAKDSGVPRKVNNLVVRNLKGDSSPKRKEPASTISKTPGFDSLKNSLIGGSTKKRNKIEKTDAAKLKILRKIVVDTFATKLILFSHSR